MTIRATLTSAGSTEKTQVNRDKVTYAILSSFQIHSTYVVFFYSAQKPTRKKKLMGGRRKDRR